MQLISFNYLHFLLLISLATLSQLIFSFILLALSILIPIPISPLISIISLAILLILSTFLHSLLCLFTLSSHDHLLLSLISIILKSITIITIIPLNATVLILLHILLTILYHAILIAVSFTHPRVNFFSDCTFLGLYLSFLENLSSMWRTLRLASEYSMLFHSYLANSRAFYHSTVSHFASINQRIMKTHWTS